MKPFQKNEVPETGLGVLTAGVLLVLFFALALKTVLHHPFLIDDVGMIYRGVDILNRPMTLFAADHAGRSHPVASLFWGAMHALFHLRPFPYYAAWLCFHAVNTLLLARIARAFGQSTRAVMTGAIFFAVLSVHHQLVAWIGDGIRVMMVTFFLYAFLCYGRYRETSKVRYLALTVVSWLFALGCMEDAIILPAVLAAYDVLSPGGSQPFPGGTEMKRRKGLQMDYLIFAAVAAAFVAWQVFGYGDALHRYTKHEFHGMQKIAGIFWTLLNLWVPHRDFFTRLPASASGLRAALPALALGPVIFLTGRVLPRLQRGHARLFLFSLVWFCAALAPFMLRDLTSWKTFPAPRYFYLPMAGFALFAGVLLDELCEEIRRFDLKGLRILFTALLTACGLYFFTVNAANYCFLAEKIARDWRVEQPPVDYFYHSPKPEGLRHYSFDLVPL